MAWYDVSTETQSEQVRRIRLETLDKVFAFLDDHYWDTLEEDRILLDEHLRECKRMLKEQWQK